MTYEYNTIDSYVVNIEIDKKVISHNADSVKGNVYTWNINKNNAADKIISIQFKNDLLDLKSEKEEKKDFNYMIIFIIFGLITLVLIIILGLIKSISNKNNKI